MFENEGKALVVRINRRLRCLGLCWLQAVEAEGSRTGEFWRAKRFHACCDRGARTCCDCCLRIQSWNECGLRTLCQTRRSVGDSGGDSKRLVTAHLVSQRMRKAAHSLGQWRRPRGAQREGIASDRTGSRLDISVRSQGGMMAHGLQLMSSVIRLWARRRRQHPPPAARGLGQNVAFCQRRRVVRSVRCVTRAHERGTIAHKKSRRWNRKTVCF
jgi:hypothetical protein